MKTKSLKKSCVFLATLIFLLSLGNCSKNPGWLRFRGPRGDGISRETNWNPKALHGGTKILWKVNIGTGHSNVVFKDGRLYAMGQPAYAELVVYCLKPKTGEEIWRHTFKSTSTGSTLTVDGNSVYGLRPEGIVFCLNAKTGEVRWEKNLVKEYEVARPRFGFNTSPIVEGDLVILNLNSAGIALNKKTGEKVWISETIPPTLCIRPDLVGYSTPVPYDRDGKRCVLLFNCTGLHCVDIKTGDNLWYHEVYLLSIADPIVFENRIFITSGEYDPMCQLLDITDKIPKLLWQKESLRNHFSSSVYVDGYLYGCDGTLHIAEATPSSYQEISRASIYANDNKTRQFWKPPVLYKGRIYCRDAMGPLICVDVSI